MSQRIVHQLTIKSDPKVVYAALTEQKGLASWWIQKCEAEPKVGFINTFQSEGYPLTEMKIQKLIENKKVHWKCVGGDKQWIGTKLKFSLRENQGHTILKFKHSKWKKQSDFFAVCNFHWARHFIMLQHYCESGKSLLNSKKERAEIKNVKEVKS